MTVRKLVQEIKVPNANIREYVWLIEKCEEDQLQFHAHFTTKHIIGIILLSEKNESTLVTWQHATSWVTPIILLLLNS